MSGNRRPATKDDGREANAAKAEKLQRDRLRRRARAHNLELRQSAYGYSLIDASRNRVDGRNDMNLADVESYLARQA